MSTAQGLTNRINDVLDAGAAAGSAELEGLANEYARMSADVNARLRRCLDFLRRGLRSEAIQHARTDPELFAMIQSLHLGRVEEWDKLCRTHGLERPRPLLLEAAKALNEAYVVERQLEPLLRQHRTLALTRAPLRGRAQVLRRIADLDPRNAVWRENLEAIEAARLGEIAAGLSQPGAVVNRTQAEALLDELIEPNRRVKPDPHLLRRVQGLVSQTRRQWAVLESERLLPALHEAHAALDMPRCRELMTQWDSTLTSVGVQLSDLPETIIESWKPIAAWVGGERDREAMREQHAQAAAELREGIDRGAPLGELEGLHRRLTAINLPIDDFLQRDYAQTVQGQRLIASRRRRTRLVVGSVAAVIVLGLVALLASDLFALRRAEQAADAGAESALRGDVAATQSHHAALVTAEPRLLGRDTWRERLAASTRTLAEAEDRRARFIAAMQLVDTAGPETVSDPALAAAASLAVTPDERAAVETARAAALRAREDAMRRRDAEAIARIAEIASAAHALDPAALERDAPAFSADLARLEAELDAIRVLAASRPAVAHAMNAAASHVAGLREMTDRVIAQQQRRAAAEEAVARLANQAHSADALAAALDSFTQRYADDPRAAAFADALQLSEGWRAVEAWSRLVSEWGGRLTARDRGDAARRIVAVEAYLQQHPRSPFQSAAARYRDDLTKPVLLLKDDGPWQSGVRRLMRTPAMTELNYVELPDGRRYYCTGDGRFRVSILGAHLDVSLTSDITQRVSRTFPADAVAPPRPSPQRQLSQSVLQLLGSAPPDAAATLPLQVLRRVMDARDVDPLLRALLITLLVNETPAADEPLAQELAEWSRPIAGFELTQVSWMNPEDAAVAELRASVAAAIDALPPLQPRIDAITAERAALHRSLSAQAVAAGVLLRDESGPRVAATVITPPTARTLEVVARRSMFDVFELRRVGVVTGGEPVLDAAAVRDLPEGSLVFFVHRAETP